MRNTIVASCQDAGKIMFGLGSSVGAFVGAWALSRNIDKTNSIGDNLPFIVGMAFLVPTGITALTLTAMKCAGYSRVYARDSERDQQIAVMNPSHASAVLGFETSIRSTNTIMSNQAGHPTGQIFFSHAQGRLLEV